MRVVGIGVYGADAPAAVHDEPGRSGARSQLVALGPGQVDPELEIDLLEGRGQREHEAVGGGHLAALISEQGVRETLGLTLARQAGELPRDDDQAGRGGPDVGQGARPWARFWTVTWPLLRPTT